MREAATVLFHSREGRRFARFVAVGLLNTAFGYAVYAGGVFAGLRPEIALLVTNVVGACFNFFTTGRLVFADRGTSRILRFLLVYAGTYLLNALALRGLIGVGLSPLVAQAVLLPVVVVVTFLALRLFVFQESTR